MEDTKLTQDRERQLQAALDAAKAGTFYYDVRQDKAYWDERSYRIFGQDPASFEANYDAWAQLLHPEGRPQVLQRMQEILQHESHFELEFRLLDVDDEERWVAVSASVERDAQGQACLIQGIHMDITQRRSDERLLNQARYIFEGINEGVVIANLDGRVVDSNPAYQKLTGFTPEAFKLKPLNLFTLSHHAELSAEQIKKQVLAEGSWSGEIWGMTQDGHGLPNYLEISLIKDQNQCQVGYLGVFEDLTRQKKNEEKMAYLAYTDLLTNLPNRVAFQTQLQQEIFDCRDNQGQLSVMYIDLDQFKDVNETLGHSIGDELLSQVALRMNQTVPDNGDLYRLGGDEFTVIVRDIEQEQEVADIARALIDQIAEPFQIGEHEITISSSIGIVFYPKDADDSNSLSKFADIAMYRAKNQGRNRYCCFTAAMNSSIQEHVEIKHDLKNAIANNELCLYYQPQIDLMTGKIIGYEALMRWIHPKKGMISPVEFIPVAEQTGLIIEMGAWSIREACQQLQRFGSPELYVAINLSPRQFNDGDLTHVLKAEMRKHKIRTNQIEIEVTESMMIENLDYSIRLLNEIRQLGINVAMDDFGTGYSSLSYLSKLPIDTLKIDRSFISDLFVKTDDTSIVRTIIMLAKNLGIKVVSEGVETLEQRDFLRMHGCEIGQGYYFSRPLPPEQLREILIKGNGMQ